MRHSAAYGEEIAVKKIIALLLGLMMLCSLACAKEATSAPAAEKTETKEETNVDKTHPIATITMKDGGVIELELYPEIAPESVKNFISLSNSGFYDGLIFHRVIAGFMIQGGDPDGRGTGGPGYCIKGEFSANGVKNDLSHLRGVISMARAQPFDSAGSQFFICHRPVRRLRQGDLRSGRGGQDRQDHHRLPGQALQGSDHGDRAGGDLGRRVRRAGKASRKMSVLM